MPAEEHAAWPLIETVMTTRGRGGGVNCAAMGVRWGADEVVFWPCDGTRTLRNLRFRGEAVAHLTDDVLLFVQAALGGDDFSVVPISIDIGDPGRPADFLDSIGVKNLPLYTDRTTEIFESLKRRGLAVGLPVTVLLDRNGCSLGHINGPAEWDSEDGRKLIEAAIRGSERAPQT